MNSVTVRVVALALSTLGIVLSRNEAATQPKRDRPESTIVSTMAEQSIVRLTDISDGPATLRLPVVSDSVESIPGVLSADDFWEIVEAGNEPAKAELRIAAPAASAEGIGGQAGRIAFIERLPTMEVEPEKDTVPSAFGDVDSPDPYRTNVVRSNRADTPLATVPNEQKREYKPQLPRSSSLKTATQTRSRGDASLFYREHAARAKVINRFATPAAPPRVERTHKAVWKATTPPESKPTEPDQAQPQRELVATAPSSAGRTTEDIYMPLDRSRFRTSRLSRPQREASRVLAGHEKEVAEPPALQLQNTPTMESAQVLRVEAPRVAEKPKPEFQEPSRSPQRRLSPPPLNGRHVAVSTQKQAEPDERVAPALSNSKKVAEPLAKVAVTKSAVTKSSGSGWSPIDLKSVEIGTGTDGSKQRPRARQASRQDQVAARQAVVQGFELAQRRAHYSSRAKFIGALRIVARSLDDQSNCTDHTRALRKALQAYEEAGDFFPPSTRPDQDVNVHVVIGGHSTELLQDVDPQRLTPSHCLREYLAFAEQEFAAALGNDLLASQSLYGLGRLEAARETTASSSEQVRSYRALTLYQTALLVDFQNFAAANELGVLLARYGQYEQAIAALRHCVRLSPQATVWTNLARIHEKMGQLEAARLAKAEAARASNLRPQLPFVANRPRVEWVDADTFVSLPPRPGAATDYQQPSTPAAQQPARQQAPVRTAKKNKRPWFFNFGK